MDVGEVRCWGVVIVRVTVVAGTVIVTISGGSVNVVTTVVGTVTVLVVVGTWIGPVVLSISV